MVNKLSIKVCENKNDEKNDLSETRQLDVSRHESCNLNPIWLKASGQGCTKISSSL